MNIEYTSSTSEAFIPAAEVDSSDAILTQHRCTHDTRLYRDIEVSLIKDFHRVLSENASNGYKFSVPGAVESTIRLIHASTDNLAISHEDAADRCFIARQCKLSLSHMLSQPKMLEKNAHLQVEGDSP